MNRIGLDAGKAEILASKLNQLLADYSIFYQNVRAYHWNIQGDKFFELHVKFEELYNDLFLKIDEIAERILTLGFKPEQNYSDYLSASDIRETDEGENGLIAVGEVLHAFKTLLLKERDILEYSGDLGDEGTNALMSDYIREQEKLVWMYSAYLAQ